MTRLLNSIMNDVAHGNCIEVMRGLPWASVDFILTDPPYLVNYRDRSGRCLANDDNDAWLKPAFRAMNRVLRPDSLCVSFYGWNKVDAFMAAWREAGFNIVGHIVFRKPYASNARYLAYMSTNRPICWRREDPAFLPHLFPTFSTSRIPAIVCTRHKNPCSP